MSCVNFMLNLKLHTWQRKNTKCIYIYMKSSLNKIFVIQIKSKICKFEAIFTI